MNPIALIGAGYGAGHQQVARAVKEGLCEVAPEVPVLTVDYLGFVSPAVRRATVGGHRFLAKHWHAAYGSVYRMTDQWSARQAFRDLETRPGRRQFWRWYAMIRPRLIVFTHPLPLLVATGPVRPDSLCPLAAVVTDYVVHESWVSPHLAAYFVASQEAAACLTAPVIRVTGIPLRKSFWTADSGWELPVPDPQVSPTLLFVTSALAMMGGVIPAVRAILAVLPNHFRVLVVAGADHRLIARLARLRSGDRRLIIAAFRTDIAHLMAASTIIVSKGGAVTLSEALAVARPLIIYRPLPGQERGNAEYLAKHGAAAIADGPAQLKAWLTRLLRERDTRAAMIGAQQALRRPRAALDIARDCLELANGPATANG